MSDIEFMRLVRKADRILKEIDIKLDKIEETFRLATEEMMAA